MTMTPVRYPVAPTTTKVKGTILDAATVVSGIEWLDGRDLFETYNCMTFDEVVGFCLPAAKTFERGASWQSGYRFAAYGGVVCKAVGLDMADQETQAREAFTNGEHRAVERALIENRLDLQSPDTLGAVGDYWDATPVTATVEDPKVALAILEDQARQFYSGVPTIIMSGYHASLLTDSGVISLEGDVLRTKLGSKVASSGSIVHPYVAATEVPMYATGEVVVLQGNLETHQSFLEAENDSFVLIERPYLLAVDCFTARVDVTIP